MQLTPDNKIEPAKGMVLLSEPFLNDPYFKRAAILLCEHNHEGSFGFVLNNYIDMELDQIMKGLPRLDTRVSVGGPVKNSNLYYVHTLGKEVDDSKEIANGIYMGGDFELIKDRILTGQISKEDIKFFIGYSGWSANQLSDEMEQKSWYVTKAQKELVMDIESDDLWAKFLKNMGPEYNEMTKLPKDPNLN